MRVANQDFLWITSSSLLLQIKEPIILWLLQAYWYQYIRECIARKEQAEYVTSQDQVDQIFTKELKREYFIDLKGLHIITNQV